MERETKGALRFREEEDQPLVGTIYFRKDQLREAGIDPPRGWRVTFEPVA